MRNRYAILIYCASFAAGIGSGILVGDVKHKNVSNKPVFRQDIDRAIERKDKAELARLLQKQPDLNANDQYGRSLLGKALQNCEWAQYAKTHGTKDGEAMMAKNRDIVRMLLDAGADPNEGRGSLSYGLQIADPELMKMLIGHGAKAIYSSKTDYSRYRFRETSGNVTDFEQCLEMAAKVGYDLNYHDSNGRTKMHALAKYADSPTASLDQTARVMISHGLDVNAVDCLGLTPYDYARSESAQKWLTKLGAKPSKLVRSFDSSKP